MLLPRSVTLLRRMLQMLNVAPRPKRVCALSLRHELNLLSQHVQQRKSLRYLPKRVCVWPRLLKRMLSWAPVLRKVCAMKTTGLPLNWRSRGTVQDVAPLRPMQLVHML